MKKILAITGIRSEYFILFPIIHQLNQNKEFELKLVLSGAHLSDWHGNMLEQIEKEFVVADKIDNLLMTNRKTQRAKGVGLLIYALSQTIEREKPDFLICVGDREEAIATAIVANYMDVLFMHIGGGDPVYGNADDPVRFAASKLAHIHCCLTQVYAENLKRIGEEDFRIFWTGSSALDAIKNEPVLSLTELSTYLKVDLTAKPYVVLIQHPLSSEKEDAGKQMESSLSALQTFCLKYNYQVIGIYPNTDPGAYDILNVISQYQDLPYLHFFKTLPQSIFVNLLKNAQALVGNSSMGIIEAPTYKLPVVNIGNRQKGRLNAGNLEFVGYEKESILTCLEKACFDISYRNHVQQLQNPYGNGDSIQKTIDILNTVDLTDKKWYVKRKLC